LQSSPLSPLIGGPRPLSDQPLDRPSDFRVVSPTNCFRLLSTRPPCFVISQSLFSVRGGDDSSLPKIFAIPTSYRSFLPSFDPRHLLSNGRCGRCLYSIFGGIIDNLPFHTSPLLCFYNPLRTPPHSCRSGLLFLRFRSTLLSVSSF